MPWCKAQFKGSEVLARCDEQGKLVAEGGRVEIRYRARDTKSYRASLANLAPVSGAALLPDDACAPAEPAPESRGGTARSGGVARSKAPAAPVAHKPLPPSALIAYTDGACSGNPGPAGVGVVLIDGSSTRELSAYLGTGTNNIAELTAIELAVAACDPERPLRVHTDSQYAIGVLTKGWKAKANQELVARLRAALARMSHCEIVYVPGHAGVPLNERADQLAVLAVQTRRTTDWQPA